MLQQLQAPGWTTRSEAVEKALTVDGILAEPRFRAAFIQLLNRESNNPNWEGMAEFDGYEHYYQLLGDAVQKIASEYHNKPAWKAVAESAYNDDSVFARWLAVQPDAYSTLVEVATRSKDQQARANVLCVLAQTCTLAKQHCEETRTLLRQRGQTADEMTHAIEVLSVLRGLGICGTAEDLRLIERMGKESADPHYQHFIRQAENQIKSRTDPAH